MTRSSSTRREILSYLRSNGSSSGPELATHLGITRQAVSLHIRGLIDAGKIVKTGSTRAARYYPADSAPNARRMKRDLLLPGLDESTIYEDVAIALNLSRLPENVESIVHYAFTEMLNNAIDHSHSNRGTIEVTIDAATINFEVRDAGIGVFHSIAGKFDLVDEQAGMIELIKGKTTTKPEAHTGEGIFFTSKAADRFVIRSHRLQIEWDRDRDDVFVSDTRFMKGTLVQFALRRSSRRRLEGVFSEFAPGKYDFRFEKTRVLVKLLQSEYLSRSEAKRLLHNLHKFSEIELDMRDVNNLGQGFADEVFRVFATAHPDIRIRTINASGAVDAMMKHALQV